MANDFNPGELVVLKSGGPPMTIEGIPSSKKGFVEDRYHCVWFKGSTRASGYFHPHVLEKYTPPIKK